MFKVSFTLEIITNAAFCTAVLFLLIHIVCAGGNSSSRLAAATFGIGFLLKLTGCRFSAAGGFTTLISACGFMMSYTAFVFTFSEKRKNNATR